MVKVVTDNGIIGMARRMEIARLREELAEKGFRIPQERDPVSAGVGMFEREHYSALVPALPKKGVLCSTGERFSVVSVVESDDPRFPVGMTLCRLGPNELIVDTDLHGELIQLRKERQDIAAAVGLLPGSHLDGIIPAIVALKEENDRIHAEACATVTILENQRATLQKDFDDMKETVEMYEAARESVGSAEEITSAALRGALLELAETKANIARQYVNAPSFGPPVLPVSCGAEPQERWAERRDGEIVEVRGTRLEGARDDWKPERVEVGMQLQDFDGDGL